MNLNIKNKNLKELKKLKKTLENQLAKVDCKIHDLSYSFNESGFLDKFKKFVESKKELCLICPIDYNDIYVDKDVKKYLKDNFTDPVKLDEDEYGDFKIYVYCSNTTPDGSYTDYVVDFDYSCGNKNIYFALDDKLTKKYNVKDFDKLFDEDDCNNYYCSLKPYDENLGVEDYDPPEAPWESQTGVGEGRPTLYKIIKKDVQGSSC